MPSDTLPLYLIDAFARPPYAGNPAAVVLLTAPQSDAWMQRVAQETNAPATAFLLPESEGVLRLRWFSLTTELVLCGHGTLASTHVLYETGRLPADATARFETRSGTLAARREGEWLLLDFPAQRSVAVEPPDELAGALGAVPVAVRRAPLDYLIELASVDEVRFLKPNIAALVAIPDARGFIVTARAEPGSEFDFVSRFFSPSTGISEDPVTGSAHCALGPYWSERLGKEYLLGWQASARGGVVRVQVQPDRDRVLLGGQAKTVFRCELIASALPDGT